MKTKRETINCVAWVKADKSSRPCEIGVMFSYIKEGRKEYFIFVRQINNEAYNLNVTDRLKLD